jgi:hypothetical protein
MAQPQKPGTAAADTPDREDTTAPAQSLTFVQTLTQAQEAGVDRDALSRLFWLLNAHPRLLGHQRCLQNLLSLMSTPEFRDGVHDWADPWIGDIPPWITAATWATELVGKATAEMAEFTRQPRDQNHQILMRHGINRHPLAGALWIRHHSDSDPSQPTATLSAPGRKFRLLQWHFFCSQAEARHSHSTLEQYLQYDRPGEWPAWPRPAAAVGLALRQLSYSPWDPLLADLPYETRLDDFVNELVDRREQLLLKHTGGEARQRLVALVSYFDDFKRYFEGLPAKRRREGGGGSGGGRKGIPGFVHFTASPHVLFEPPEPDTGDEDVPTRNVTRAYVHSDGLTPQNVEELEGLGIAPSEDLQPIMDLFPLEDRPGGIHDLWEIRKATEAAAQRDYWDKTQLTPFEVATLLDTVDTPEQEQAEPAAVVPDQAARLVLRSMLVLGCTQEEARTIRTMQSTELSARASNEDGLATRVILMDSQSGQCVGFVVRAIGPRYTSEPPESFSQCANAATRRLTLPDLTGLGAALLHHQRRAGGGLCGPVFHETPEQLEAQTKRLLGAANLRLDSQSRARLTTTKVSRKLPSLLSRAGVDEVGIALICCERRFQSQARLHYTQHRTEDLIGAYAKAIRRMYAETGRTLAPSVRMERTEDSAVVGARLVVRPEELGRFVRALRSELEQSPAYARSATHRYHQILVLYTLLMQGLMTGIRPSSRPERLMAEAFAYDRPNNDAHLIVSLVEKDDQYQARARPVAIPCRLQRQFANVAAHAQATWRWHPTDLTFPSDKYAAKTLVDWADDRTAPRAQPVNGQWMTRQLTRFGLPAAANFTRAYLRTWLLKDGCVEQVVDAFLGHAEAGQSPTSMHGTLDFAHHLCEIGARLERMAASLGLEPVRSRLSQHRAGHFATPSSEH